MRTPFLVAALLAVPALAGAQTSVYETAQGSATVHSVLVTNTVSVQVDSSTRSIAGYSRYVIEVYNDDSTNNAFCGFNVAVSSLTTQGIYGRRIPARTSWTVTIPAAVAMFCVGDVLAGVRLVLTQLF